VEKYFTAGQATNDNITHAHWMLNNEGYKHTIRFCNAYGFSSKRIVIRPRLNVTSHVHCLSCYVYPFTNIYTFWVYIH